MEELQGSKMVEDCTSDTCRAAKDCALHCSNACFDSIFVLGRLGVRCFPGSRLDLGSPELTFRCET